MHKFVLYYPVIDSADEAIKDLDGNIIEFDTVDEAITFRDTKGREDIHPDNHYWVFYKDYKGNECSLKSCYIALNEGQF